MFGNIDCYKIRTITNGYQQKTKKKTLNLSHLMTSRFFFHFLMVRAILINMALCKYKS